MQEESQSLLLPPPMSKTEHVQISPKSLEKISGDAVASLDCQSLNEDDKDEEKESTENPEQETEGSDETGEGSGLDRASSKEGDELVHLEPVQEEAEGEEESGNEEVAVFVENESRTMKSDSNLVSVVILDNILRFDNIMYVFLSESICKYDIKPIVNTGIF